MASKHLILVLGLLTVDAMIACDKPLNSGISTLGTGGAGPAVDASATGGDAAADGTTDGSAPLLPAPVLDPAGTYGGKTYAEWGTAWWKWLMELPGPDFPCADHTGAFCALGQSGGEDGSAGANAPFFLAGIMDTSPCTSPCIVTRTCTIPAGKMILVPMAGWYGDNGGIPDGGQTYSDQYWQGVCSTSAAEVTGLTLEIDGQSYGSTVSDFARYLTVWTQFSYTVPSTPSNYFVTFGGSTYTGPVPVSFAGGYNILLAPLSAGSHTIHFAVSVGGASGFTNDITYNLTVQ